MSATVEQLPGEPIILLTFTGLIDSETVKNAFIESAALAENIDGTVYRITDVRLGEAGFKDVLQVVAQVRERTPGSSSDPKIKGVFVGTHPLARLYADFMRQIGIKTPFFKTLEEALDYIRVELKQGQKPL